MLTLTSSTALALHSELEGVCLCQGERISSTPNTLPRTRPATGVGQSWEDPPQPVPGLPRGTPTSQPPPSWCYRPCPGAHTLFARKPYINKVLSCVDFHTRCVFPHPNSPEGGFYQYRLESSDFRTKIHSRNFLSLPAILLPSWGLRLNCSLGQLYPPLPSSPG